LSRKQKGSAVNILSFVGHATVRRRVMGDDFKFDRQKVIDRSTMTQPQREPVDMDFVMVNGALVIERGKPASARPGKAVGR